MKDKLALVIAALMMTSMALSISTTTVSAVHTPTVSIDEDTVKGDTPMIRTITITNTSGDPIDNVRIILPPEVTDVDPTMMVFKDNQVHIETDNVVTLPAETLIKLSSGAVTAVAGTSLIIPENTRIRWQPVGDNVDADLRADLTAQLNENFTFTIGAENATTSEGVTITDNENLVALVEDTQVVWLASDNKVMLPVDTKVKFVNETSAILEADNKVKLAYDVNVELDDDNTIDPPTENTGRKFLAVSTATTSTIYMVSVGENVWINRAGTENIIIFKEDTEVVLAAANTVTLFADTEVIRAANENVTLLAGTTTENQPKNWTQDSGTSTLPSGPYVEWVGIGENQIASGESLDFPFAFTSLGSGDYTIYVKTKDTKGVVVQTEIALTFDNVSPTVEIAVSPEWAKDSTEITITVTADEPLAKLDNVMVAENQAPENTQISMTPDADDTVWTGTYTTGDNENRDGTATIYVIGEQYEDLVGNAGTDVDSKTFTVDRRAPPMPDLSAITGFPTSPTTTATRFIENEAMDNFLGNLVPLEGGVVKIRVGTTVYDVTPTTSGYYGKSITLTEGTQEVGIHYIDRAGNVGEENAENIILDTMAPSITWGTIAGKALVDGVQINTKAPKITLTISDAGLGVDNWAFAVDNTGYSVQLWDENENVIGDNLANALAHDNNVLAFENTIPEQADGTYYIYVVAGDSQLMDNDLIKFVIDTDAPDAPVVDAAYEIVSTMDNPLVVKSISRTIAGDAEAGATITVYGTVDTTETVLGTGKAESRWTVQFTLTAGSNTKIEISATDEAGNEGSRTLYGWILADDSAPSVTLDELPETTDKTSITISGTVGKDDWEDWSDITLTVQVGTGQVTVPIGAGGSYSYSLELAEGQNTIVVQAIDVVGNLSDAASDVVERTVTPWAIYAIILVIVALVLAAIAIFREPIFGRKK